MSDHTQLLQTDPHLHTAHLPYTGTGTQAILARRPEEGCEVWVGLPAWSASWIGKAFEKCSVGGKKANSNFLRKSVLWPLPQGDRHHLQTHRNLTFKYTVCVSKNICMFLTMYYVHSVWRLNTRNLEAHQHHCPQGHQSHHSHHSHHRHHPRPRQKASATWKRAKGSQQ